MVRCENQCVGCPPEIGCLGSSCPNMNVKIYECEDCHDEVENLYEYNGMELCLSCVEKRLDKIE